MEKPSHKPRPVSAHRSMSVMTIDTAIAQNAYTPQLRRNHSVAQPRPRSVYSSEPVMSPDELTAKIADSFQQFSSMLNQMQKTTPNARKEHVPHSPDISRPATPSSNKLPGNAINSKRNSGGSKRHSLREDYTNKNAILSPISLVSPSALNTAITTKHSNGIQQEVFISPLDNSSQLNQQPQPRKNLPLSNTKKWTKKVQDKQLANKFLRAASNGDTQLVQDLIHKCKDLIYAADDDEGSTGLIYATCFGHLVTVETLLEAKAPIDEPDNRKCTKENDILSVC